MNKEFEFLNIINNSLDDKNYLGDDCAYLNEYNLSISTDSFIEDVHFSKKYMTPYEIASKALLVNISDILASGATPKYLTIALSGNLDNSFVKEFYKGVNDTIKKFNMKVIGGDLTKSEKIMINVTVFGNLKNKTPSSRKNAKIGYIVATIGEFGSSAQGLEDLRHNKNNYYTNYHKKPTLYPDLAQEISTKVKNDYAMMDSSDGLIDCLTQISEKSNVRIDIEYDKINKKTDNKDFVLYGGEDYALVLCLDENDFKNFNGLTKIGTCKAGDGVYIDNKRIEHKGFNHFE